jgi:hypothetical protein
MKLSPVVSPLTVPLELPFTRPLPLAAASGSHEGHMVIWCIDRGGCGIEAGKGGNAKIEFELMFEGRAEVGICMRGGRENVL